MYFLFSIDTLVMGTHWKPVADPGCLETGLIHVCIKVLGFALLILSHFS